MGEVDIPLDSIQAFQDVFATIKQGWGPGPWQDEPDVDGWLDAESAYPCFAARNSFGCWAAYVGVPAGHALHGTHPDDVVPQPLVLAARAGVESSPSRLLLRALYLGDAEDPVGEGSIGMLLDVHGGITFSGERRIAGFEAHWFFGFDCAHASDLVPSMEAALAQLGRALPTPEDAFTAKVLSDLRGASFEKQYRDLPYVREQTTNLAHQLKACDLH